MKDSERDIIIDAMLLEYSYVDLYRALLEHLDTKITRQLDIMAEDDIEFPDLSKDIKEYLYINIENYILFVMDDGSYITLRATSCTKEYTGASITAETTLTHEDSNDVETFSKDYSEEDLDIAIKDLINLYVNHSRDIK